MYKTQEHPYKLLKRVIASKDLPAVILLHGKERFMIEWAIKSLKNAVVNPATESMDYTLFNEKDDTEMEIIAACETLPFMSERKVVVVKDIDVDLSDYISDIPNTTLLIIVQNTVDKRKSLYKKIEKIGLAYDFTALDEATLVSWVHKRIPNISKQDILMFATTAGYFDKDRSYELFSFENDLAKAKALYEGKEVITYEDMLAISSADTENNAFKLLDAAFSDRKSEAMRMLNEYENISDILRFHGLLCSQLEIMVEARENPNIAGINPYRLKKAIEASSKLSTARLKAALSACYKIENEIKSGRIDARLSLELFIAKI
ncbi:MAG: DNA polymerase III subunit delta [Bacillota bacterium]|nr:DNA polymerase III subunit delta [Bacillota bacterium]